MSVRHAAALAIVALPASPAAAAWTHAPSGVGVPDSVGDMRVGAQRDLLGDGTDVFVQYGTDDEPVTLNVYRSSHPNPALWFERTRAAMATNVGGFDQAAPARTFNLGAASAPNGLRGEFALGGTPWRATAVAIAQHGEWIVKARVTSKTLDAAGVAARMDALLGAVRFAAAPGAAPLPLTAPGPCPDVARFGGKRRVGDEDRAMGAVLGVVAYDGARGRGGLAAEPHLWCRQPVAGGLAQSVSLYRKRDGGAWTMLMGDAGVVASAYSFPALGGRKAGAAVYFTRTGPAMLVETFDALPSAEEGAGAALAVLAGRRRPLATIGTERRD